MNDFKLYFGLGTDHILTWEAMDHILFVAALCLRYLWKDWKKVAVMVTAFTIGHSITLALSALNYVSVPTKWIEFLIPLTIAVTAINNILQKNPEQQKKLPLIYFFALFFGLIHGLAYASSFLDLEGKEGLVAHLFAFNLGIELAQLLVVMCVLFISFLFVQLPGILLEKNNINQAWISGVIKNLLKISRLGWIRVASYTILAFSLYMAFHRFPYKTTNNNEKTVFMPIGNHLHVQYTLCTKHPKQSGV
ncbi:MAG TPA: HupE/UreJ family protein [Chitinophagaceae bacterium]|nr:HupE/UreJ family protein [Chitinophagaceae bacterium]